MERRIDNQTESTARQISMKESRPWYICRRYASKDVVVSDHDLERYMSLGYRVLCAYFEGKRYKNLYMVDGRIHFVR